MNKKGDLCKRHITGRLPTEDVNYLLDQLVPAIRNTGFKANKSTALSVCVKLAALAEVEEKKDLLTELLQ